MMPRHLRHLKKTCRKLDVSFWQYLQDRLMQTGAVAPLSELKFTVYPRETGDAASPG
jgi:hypothetical protein